MTHCYLPHHQTLSTKIAEFLKNSRKAEVLDCHNFRQCRFQLMIILSMDRPDFCLGLTGFATFRMN